MLLKKCMLFICSKKKDDASAFYSPGDWTMNLIATPDSGDDDTDGSHDNQLPPRKMTLRAKKSTPQKKRRVKLSRV